MALTSSNNKSNNKNDTNDYKVETKRRLTSRHVSMIALGGCIGTGLFVASGGTIHSAGPGGSLLAYTLVGIMVYFLMTSLGELATHQPVTGSFATYCTKYVSPAMGFATGWNYWLNWAITVAVDISTIGLVMEFWLPNFPTWIWSLGALTLILLINLMSVGTFGETEFWLSLIKVVTIIIFLIVGILIIFGIIGGHFIGLKNFTYKQAPFVGGFGAFFSAIIVAAFSFQGTELLGMTVAETKDPKTTVPKSIRQVFWRILLFYVLAIFIIAAIIPYTSKYLLGSEVSDISISPFTLVFQRAGLALAASVINAVILTSVLSAANSGMYASTRMLYSMALKHEAPKIFTRVSKSGVPYVALIVTILVASLAFLTSIIGPQIYLWLVSASALTGIIAWMGISIAHYRFRRAFILQGHHIDELTYHAKLFPIGPILTLIVCIIIIIFQDMDQVGSLSIWQILVTYMAIPLFVGMYIWYKVTHHSHLIPLDKIDVSAYNPAKTTKK